MVEVVGDLRGNGPLAVVSAVGGGYASQQLVAVARDDHGHVDAVPGLGESLDPSYRPDPAGISRHRRVGEDEAALGRSQLEDGVVDDISHLVDKVPDLITHRPRTLAVEDGEDGVARQMVVDEDEPIAGRRLARLNQLHGHGPLPDGREPDQVDDPGRRAHLLHPRSRRSVTGSASCDNWAAGGKSLWSRTPGLMFGFWPRPVADGRSLAVRPVTRKGAPMGRGSMGPRRPFSMVLVETRRAR